jgi:hypothetical protein
MGDAFVGTRGWGREVEDGVEDEVEDGVEDEVEDGVEDEVEDGVSDEVEDWRPHRRTDTIPANVTEVVGEGRLLQLAHPVRQRLRAPRVV